MVAFGGAGGLFATEVADFLGISTIISPPNPGNLCAFGLHVSRRPPRLHPHPGAPAVVRPTPTRYSRPGVSCRRPASPTSAPRGYRRKRSAIHRVADVRYFGEGHEVQVDIPAGLAGAPRSPTCGRISTGCTTAISAFTMRASRMSSWSICASRRSAGSIVPAVRPDAAAARTGAALRLPQCLLAADRLGRLPALPPLGACPRPERSTGRRSSRSTARRWSCRRAGMLRSRR